MPAEFLYSVRMRANSPDGHHVSGAERIVAESEVPAVSSELLGRALSRAAIGEAHVSVDRRPAAEVHPIACLPVVQLSSPALIARQLERITTEAGLDQDVFGWALWAMASGLLPEGGAALATLNGKLVHPDDLRGVRVRHFDYSPAGCLAARLTLEQAGLSHFRTFEALALASKVAWSGVALEVCWSDEPDYLTGYIATREHGYVRVPDWKPKGAPGGRVFFLAPEVDPAECVRRLEEEWALIEPPVRIVERGV